VELFFEYSTEEALVEVIDLETFSEPFLFALTEDIDTLAFDEFVAFPPVSSFCKTEWFLYEISESLSLFLSLAGPSLAFLPDLPSF